MSEWKQTVGEITRSEIGVYITEDGTRLERPIITWTFDVNGKRYQGHAPEGGMIWAKWVLNKYPLGQRVTVRYNPDQPEQSTVEGLYYAIYGPAVLIVLVPTIVVLVLIALA